MGKSFIKSLVEYCEDAVFPPACPICDGARPIKNGIRVDICEWCKEKINYIKEPACIKCGKSLEDDSKEYCADCAKTNHIYDQAVSLYEYSDYIKKSVYRFKYHNRREYAHIYAKEIAAECGIVINTWKPEVIMPVPIHFSKLKSRGYNQAGLIAQCLGKILNIKVDEDYLIRVKKTIPMKELNNSQRFKNLENAFQTNDNGIIYKKVLIVDDIYTTGATIDECAKCLKKRGTKEVYAVTLCIGNGF